MKTLVQIGDKTRMVELTQEEGTLHAAIDGEKIATDAVEVEPGIYSILIGGHAYEVRVEKLPKGNRVSVGESEDLLTASDPRKWKRGGGAGAQADGRQQLTAPMPGKVIRVLAKAGDTVEAGQGVLVVEAMKMQNEVRTPKTGVVERISAAEGQTVNAGDVLAIIG